MIENISANWSRIMKMEEVFEKVFVNRSRMLKYQGFTIEFSQRLKYRTRVFIRKDGELINTIIIGRDIRGGFMKIRKCLAVQDPRVKLADDKIEGVHRG